MVRWEMREAHGLICAGWGACKQNRQEISPLDNFLSLFLSPFLWNGSDEFGGEYKNQREINTSPGKIIQGSNTRASFSGGLKINTGTR